MKYLFSLLFLYTVVISQSLAQDGTLDWTFNNNTGVIRHKINNTETWFTDMATCPDGKIVVSASKNVYDRYTFSITRYNSNGTLDNSFAVNGQFLYNDGSTYVYVNRLLPLPDGRLLVNAGLFLMMLKNNGTRDSSFGTNGQLHSPHCFANSIAYSKKDNSIVCAAMYNVNQNINKYGLRLNKIDMSGNAVASFGNGGIDSLAYPDGLTDPNKSFNTEDMAGMANLFCDDAGYIYYSYREHDLYHTVQRRACIGRVNEYGIRDTLYGNAGVAVAYESNDDMVGAFAGTDKEGNIFIGLYPYAYAMHDWDKRIRKIAKLKPDGMLDTTFGTKGVYTSNFSNDDMIANFHAVQGRYYLATHPKGLNDTLYMNVQCFDKNMNPDPTFGTNGHARHFQKLDRSSYYELLDMEVDPSGNLILVSRGPESSGGYLTYIFKVNSSLFPMQVETTAKQKGLRIYPNPTQNGLTIDISNPTAGVPVQVFNISGQKVYEFLPNQTNRVQTTNWTRGIYFIRYGGDVEQITIQ